MVVETDFNILIFEHILHLKFKNLSNKFFSVAGNTAQNAVVLPNPVVLLSMKNLWSEKFSDTNPASWHN